MLKINHYPLKSFRLEWNVTFSETTITNETTIKLRTSWIPESHTSIEWVIITLRRNGNLIGDPVCTRDKCWWSEAYSLQNVTLYSLVDRHKHFWSLHRLCRRVSSVMVTLHCQCMVYFTLKMEAACPRQVLVSTRRHIPGVCNLPIRYRKNLKSYRAWTYYWIELNVNRVESRIFFQYAHQLSRSVTARIVLTWPILRAWRRRQRLSYWIELDANRVESRIFFNTLTNFHVP
jgi:hypothetical protein